MNSDLILILLGLAVAWAAWVWFLSLPVWARTALAVGVCWLALRVVADHVTPLTVLTVVAVFAGAGWMWLSAMAHPRAGRPAAARGAGRCGACGQYSDDVTSHEAAHWVTATDMGYQVPGARVERDGSGFTRIPGLDAGPGWDRMVISAAGASGENRNRIFDVGLNGSRHTKYSDAWWVHRLAPQVATERGITTAEAIRQARKEADRRVASNSGQWRRLRDQLAKDGQVGDVG